MSVGTTRTARQVAFTLEVKSPQIFENIFLNNGVLVLLGAKGNVRLKRGGNRFDERTHLGQNSNVAHRDKFAEIATDFQDNWRTAEYGQAVISGASPINMVESDQNAGKERISELSTEVMNDLIDTYPNKIGTALLASSTTGVDPVSLAVELPATAFGSQTQVTGGITRSDFPGTGMVGIQQRMVI